MKKRWLLIPIIGATAILLWSVSTPSNAIVEARVNLTAPYGNGFLAQAETTHAFRNSYGEGLGAFFEVWSKCSLHVGQTIDISVEVSGTLFGSHPKNIEGQLYKPGGLMNTGFVPWDGC